LKVFTIPGKNLSQTWEQALLKTWREGSLAYTEYEQWSKDCTMLIIIEDPCSEPRIHMGGLCGSLSDLYAYVKEVVEGSEDHFVYEGKRPYEYHERLFDYRINQDLSVDQVDYIINKLCESRSVELEGKVIPVKGYSRRAQAITWKPSVDSSLEHPPCLQRIWCRIIESKLVMETCWRSRDAYKAAFWNMYAFTELQKYLTKKINAKLGEKIEVGAYIDFSNSFHIYERDFPDIQNRFLKLVNGRKFEERTMKTADYIKHLHQIGVIEK
jgi:thymidylate synthase